MQPPLVGTKFCFQCGTRLAAHDGFCARCGVAQGGPAPVAVPVPYIYHPPVTGRKSRVAAILIAFFLGGFGGHKFYLGRPGMGLLYLFFFWTLIPGFVALVELIIYATMSDEQFALKYG